MKALELSALLRAADGDACSVANTHILSQKRLEEADDAFLRCHMGSFPGLVLLTWLCHRPSCAAPIVEAVVAAILRVPSEPDLLLCLGIQNCTDQLEENVLDDLLERLRSKVPPVGWHAMACRHQGGCPSFKAALIDVENVELALRLFEHRRDEQAAIRALPSLARTGTLEERSRVVHSMLRLGSLVHVSPLDVLPEEVRFPFEDDHPDGFDHPGETFAAVALAWPGANRDAARGWFVEQVLRAGGRTRRWDLVWPHIPEDLRDAVAYASLDGPVTAPWLGVTLEAALARREAGSWDRCFRYLDTPGALDGDRVFAYAMDRSRARVADSSKSILSELLFPKEHAAKLLLDAPGPELPDDAFDAKLASYLPLLSECRGLEWSAKPALFERLASFPLTKSRANRLLAMALGDGENLGIHSNREVLARVALGADPVSPSTQLSVDWFVAPNDMAAGLAVFRHLRGETANEELRRWLLAPATDECIPARAWGTLARAAVLPELVDDAVQTEIRALIRLQDTTGLLGILETYAPTMPWATSEAEVLQLAQERAATEPGRWFPKDTATLPSFLRPAALKRVPAVVDDTERARLLAWLEGLGEGLEGLFGTVLRALPHVLPGRYTAAWLGTALKSRTRWDRLGAPLVGALLDAGASDAVLAVARASVAGVDPDAREGRSIVVAIHEVLARALLKRGGAAARRDDELAAKAALYALTALHPPAALSKAVHGFGREHASKAGLEELVELNLSLLSHGTTKEATLGDVRICLGLLHEAERRVARASSALEP